jgi:radical SAM protein with 4Fe4S-binding SPASM domain
VGAGVSIDGPRELHDQLRGVKGSFDSALVALEAIRETGLVASVNSQITKLVIPHLRELQEIFIEKQAKNWQVQLTVAMGRAADHPELLLQPYDLLEVMPLLAELYHIGETRGLLLQAGNNVGYYGPYEYLFRGYGSGKGHYVGCLAGQTGIGIEADGTIKGCPSLPTNPYAGGNIREIPLEEIWRAADSPMAFTRQRGTEDLWGFCAGCYYAEICRGGCNWTSHSLLGRRGNNPYCHHRTLELAAHGLRERVVQTESAPGCSFDHGKFDLILEPLDAVTDSFDVMDLARRANGVEVPDAPREVRYPAPYAGTKPGLKRRTPPLLVMCRGCSRFVGPDEEHCPFCDARLVEAQATYEEKLARAQRASERLMELIGA